MDFSSIPNYADWDSIEQINYGWSEDNKYIIKSGSKKFVLRVSDISYYQKKKSEFDFMKTLHESFQSMSTPIAFGTFDNENYVYILVDYIEGIQVEQMIPRIGKDKQYALGYKAGRYLKQIHEALGFVEDYSFKDQYTSKINQRISEFRNLHIENKQIEDLIQFVQEHLYVLDGCKSVYHHGDFHVGNLITNDDLDLFVIDFNRIKKGDPLYEFNRILISSQFSTSFAKGQIDGYFEGYPTIEDFVKIKFFIASVQIGTLAWAMKYGDDDVSFAYRSLEHFFNSYDDLKRDIPSWYEEEGE